MQKVSKRITGKFYYLIYTLAIVSFLIFKAAITSEAAVSNTDINSYSKANGDTYASLSSERKKGYEIARNDALNNTVTSSFYSYEQIYGYYLYMYDHPAIANNATKVTKTQASETLSKASAIAARATGNTTYEKALSRHDLLCDTVEY